MDKLDGVMKDLKKASAKKKFDEMLKAILDSDAAKKAESISITLTKPSKKKKEDDEEDE